jgi:hypothetical protein
VKTALQVANRCSDELPCRKKLTVDFNGGNQSSWAEDNGTDFIFGLASNAVLDALVAEIADDLRSIMR